MELRLKEIYGAYYPDEDAYVNQYLIKAPYSVSIKTKAWDYAYQLVRYIEK